MQNRLPLAALLILLSASLSLAEEDAPTFQDEAASSNTPQDEAIYDSTLKEVEEIRKQLGPDFSIESKELGIERERAKDNPSKSHPSDEQWPGTKLYREVRELVNKFRHDARHLEEMAAHAEQLSEFPLADQLREMARRQWEAARELSRPRSTQSYHQPGHPSPVTGKMPPNREPGPQRAPHENRPPVLRGPMEPITPYGVPAAPNHRFNGPNAPEPTKR